jgi:mycothiol system anti-sigma-R factor
MNDRKSSVNDIACPAVAELAFEYLDGEMPASRRTAIDAHVGRCQACREHMERERSFLTSLRSCMEGEKCPDVVRERIREAMQKRREAHSG